MQGRKVHRYTALSEFWSGQKNIVLLDPNITASPECVKIFDELAQTKAYIDFSQGLDIQMLTKEKIQALNHVKFKRIHFAWDRPQEDLRDHFSLLHQELKRCNRKTVSAYVLTNFTSTHEQDMHRVMFLRSCNIQPYVMIYRKSTAPPITRRLQRWVNTPMFFWKYKTLQEFQKKEYKSIVEVDDYDTE